MADTFALYLQRRAIRADKEAPVWIGGEVRHRNTVLVSVVSQVSSWASPADCCLLTRCYRLAKAVPKEDSTSGSCGRHQQAPGGVLEGVAAQVAGVVTPIVV